MPFLLSFKNYVVNSPLSFLRHQSVHHLLLFFFLEETPPSTLFFAFYYLLSLSSFSFLYLGNLVYTLPTIKDCPKYLCLAMDVWYERFSFIYLFIFLVLLPFALFFFNYYYLFLLRSFVLWLLLVRGTMGLLHLNQIPSISRSKFRASFAKLRDSLTPID